MRYWLASVLAMVCEGLPVLAQNGDTKWQFEVASIRECIDSGAHPPVKSSPGRLSLTCWPLRRLIEEAYDVFAEGRVNPLNPTYPMVPIEGGPAWMNSAKYTINATTAEPQSVAMMRGPIMRELLEDQFRLRTHRETRETSVSIMTVAKDGPKMQPAKEGSCNHLDTTDPTQSLKLMPGDKPWCVVTSPSSVDGKHWVWDVSAIGMNLFARLIKIDGLWVINRTGLTGTFDIHLEWNYVPPDSAPPDAGTASEPLGTSLASAIYKKLGLQLTPGKGPREFLLIDHIERPSEN